MNHTHLLSRIIAVPCCLLLLLSGCGKDKEDSSDSAVSEEEIVEEKDYLSVDTSIAYSAGNTSDWSYGNQRKEFPDNDACYVRVASTAITSGSFGKGRGDEIAVTYRFTGTENCSVEISDGRATKLDSDDPNIVEFTRFITAEKSKKADEDILIFRYLPDGAESMTLEVIYDDQVAERFDAFNTVYFISGTDTQ